MSQPGVSQPAERDRVPIIITALTGLLGTGIVVSIFNSFLSYVNAPYVKVLTRSDSGKDNRNASILMLNTGGAAATPAFFP